MDWQKIILRTFLFLASFQFTSAKAFLPDSLLKDAIQKGINYLASSQVKDQKDSLGIIGEWPSFIKNERKIPYLGKKDKTAYDSNVFNTLFVYNILAEVYLQNKNEAIIPILQLALSNFQFYQNGNSFNFWPLLDRPEKFKCKHPNCKQRRPAHFKHNYKIINEYSNIYDDADDTSAGVLAYHYASQLKLSTATSTDKNYFVNFVQHRDTGKRRTNWYNKRMGFKYRTGAYLTWFGPDRKHSGFFSWFFPYHKKQNILYGRNEIDCIVNANVLRTFYVKGDTTLPGIKESKAFLKKVVAKHKCFTCGVYYPTEFSFHYALAKAISSGVSGMEEERELLLKQVKYATSQGAIRSTEVGGNELQATLFAVNAMLLLDPKKETAILAEPALEYIFLNMLTEQQNAHWPGGAFFSGGSAVRYLHLWRSDPYTTALAIEAFSNYLKIKKDT
jgi:hypothetical protein